MKRCLKQLPKALRSQGKIKLHFAHQGRQRIAGLVPHAVRSKQHVDQRPGSLDFGEFLHAPDVRGALGVDRIDGGGYRLNRVHADAETVHERVERLPDVFVSIVNYQGQVMIFFIGASHFSIKHIHRGL